MSVRVLKSVRFSNSAASILFGAAALLALGANSASADSVMKQCADKWNAAKEAGKLLVPQAGRTGHLELPIYPLGKGILAGPIQELLVGQRPRACPSHGQMRQQLQTQSIGDLPHRLIG